MSKLISVTAALGLALLTASVADARTLPARLGSSAFPVDATCWTPFGPTITNTCNTDKFWYVPLPIDGVGVFGTFNVTVWAQSPTGLGLVSCRLWTANADGSGGTPWPNSNTFVPVPFSGFPAAISLTATVPVDGTISLDCRVGPTGKIHTVIY
jgi:hypothetical protein